MEIGLVGAPNSGKSTFFNAATLGNAETGNRPFVTIKPNQGIGHVKVKCPHEEKGKQCKPAHGYCLNGWRFVPIKLWDVAGLVPGAWEGKGLGNQFLNNLMVADALIHVLDASGQTDLQGNIVEKNAFNPVETMDFLEREIDYWVKGIMERSWGDLKHAKPEKAGDLLAKHLSGLGISAESVKACLSKAGFEGKVCDWSEEQKLEFAGSVRKECKPLIVAANKADSNSAEENIKALGKNLGENFVAVSAEAELALRKAGEAGLIKYAPGENSFELLKDIPESQGKALEFIQKNVLEKFNGTGVQEVINKAAFELLGLIVVFPVEDQHNWSDSKGNLLPDAILLKKGSNALDLAYKVHSKIGENFIAAVNCRTGQKIGRDSELKHLDIVKIASK